MSAVLKRPNHAAGYAALPAAKTIAVSFHNIPTDGSRLFQVQPGMDADNASAEAEILMDFVKRQLETAMAESDDMHAMMHRDDVYTMVVLMEMAKALRIAAGTVA